MPKQVGFKNRTGVLRGDHGFLNLHETLPLHSEFKVLVVLRRPALKGWVLAYFVVFDLIVGLPVLEDSLFYH
jgi:hypothetical protein